MATPPTYSYSYDPWSPSNDDGSKADRLRLIIGDRGPDNWYLSDEEIEMFLGDNPNNIYMAAYQAASSIVSVLGPQVSKSIGRTSIQLDQAFQHFKEVVADCYLRATTRSTSTPRAYSSTHTAIFSIGQMDYDTTDDLSRTL
jgi:hypothetical protein